MPNYLNRFLINSTIGVLSLGISQVIPNDMAYGADGANNSQIEAAPQPQVDPKPLPAPQPPTMVLLPAPDSTAGETLKVQITVDSTQVNPMVRERYQMFAKPDPQNTKSKKVLFNIKKEETTQGDFVFEGVKEAKELQLFVVKDNYQRECMPKDPKLKEKMDDKTSTIKELPVSVSVKLEQSDTYLKETNEKKFSGVDAVPTCTITAMEFKSDTK